MIPEPKTAEEHGIAAILHFFYGLMAADGAISKKEVDKIKILLYKFDRGLPGEFNDNHQKMLEMLEDLDYDDWSMDKHLDVGIEFWSKYFNSGEADEAHLETIVEIVEILSEIDEVSNDEVKYIERMNKEFQERFNFEA